MLMLNKFFHFIRSFRVQLLLGMASIIGTALIFEFYIFVSTSHLQLALDSANALTSSLAEIKTELASLVQASFYFFAFTLLLVSGILIYLLYTLSSSLGVILHGIKSLKNNLSHRINLYSDNEFGEIAQFLNQIFDHIESLVKERTQALEAEKEKLETVLSGIEDSVIAINHQYNIISFNKAAEQLTGHTAKHAIGKPLSSIITLLHHQQTLTVDKYCALTLPETELFRNDNLILVAAEHKQIPVRLIVRKLDQTLSSHPGAILTFHDHTHDQELETMKLDFVSMAAHELRTPLTSIRGYANILVKDLQGQNLTKDQLELVRRINVNSEQLGSLIDNLLSVSKIERNVFTTNMQSHDLVKMISEIIDGYRTVATIKQQTIDFIKPTDSLMIDMDNVRITQVIGNLLNNAVNYSSMGGHILVGIEIQTPYVLVYIQDDGQGIPESALPKLFTKFYRVSGALEQGSKGTGLGLFICKAIVELHKGKIWAESKLGKGSKFMFKLPIRAQLGAIEDNNLQETSRSGIVINRKRHPNTEISANFPSPTAAQSESVNSIV